MTAPELVFLSRNPCPNSGPDWIYGEDCGSVESSMTTWGYCGQCWENHRVPLPWVNRVEAAAAAQRASLGIAE